MEKVEYELSALDGVSLSADGQSIALAGKTGSAEVCMNLPIGQVQALLVGLGTALQSSSETLSGPRSKTTALPIHSIVFARSKSHPESIFLSALLTHKGLSVPFLVPKNSFVRFCEGALSYFAPRKLRAPVQFDRPLSH